MSLEAFCGLGILIQGPMRFGQGKIRDDTYSVSEYPVLGFLPTLYLASGISVSAKEMAVAAISVAGDRTSDSPSQDRHALGDSMPECNVASRSA